MLAKLRKRNAGLAASKQCHMDAKPWQKTLAVGSDSKAPDSKGPGSKQALCVGLAGSAWTPAACEPTCCVMPLQQMTLYSSLQACRQSRCERAGLPAQSYHCPAACRIAVAG